MVEGKLCFKQGCGIRFFKQNLINVVFAVFMSVFGRVQTSSVVGSFWLKGEASGVMGLRFKFFGINQ